MSEPDRIELTGDGVRGNRRFYFVDDDGRRFTLARSGALASLSADYDPDTRRLAIHFPGGRKVEEQAHLGAPIETEVEYLGVRTVSGHVVEGPWAAAVSEFVGRKLRLCHTDEMHEREHQVTLVSEASVARLAAAAGTDVDARRFRMLIGVDGCAAHEEDEWIGRNVRIGEAVVRPLGTVARCAITTRNPETGDVDLDALRLISSYRGVVDGQIPFGVYGEIIEPGSVRIGDAVDPVPDQ